MEFTFISIFTLVSLLDFLFRKKVQILKKARHKVLPREMLRTTHQNMHGILGLSRKDRTTTTTSPRDSAGTPASTSIFPKHSFHPPSFLNVHTYYRTTFIYVMPVLY